jgi:ribosomal protein S18 acetylase RimI-like enzyme
MMIIRCATQLDLFPLADLTQREADWLNYIAAKRTRSDTRVEVAEQDGSVVGFVLVRVIQRGRQIQDSWLKNTVRKLLNCAEPKADSILQPIRIGFVEELFVYPGLRDQNVATALLESAIQWLLQQHVDELQTEISPDDAAAQDFFCKIGFETSQFLVRKRL